MRGSDKTSGSLFSYVDVEQRIPTKHPLRTIRQIVNEVPVSLDAEGTKPPIPNGTPNWEHQLVSDISTCETDLAA
jgi:hypothetical protein